jgi:dihydrofolate reductase
MVLATMTIVRSTISVSLDGYVAGPNQSAENPLGEGGERLHDWAIATEGWRKQHGREGGTTGPDSDITERHFEGIGAHIMGRNMFGPPSGGAWDQDWKGWWGDDPPYHAPVYVLTHHPREPLEMEGGTTFYFVTDGIEAALEQARAAVGDGGVFVNGGAATINQYLAAGLLDELFLHVVPIVLGGGARLLEGVGSPKLEPVEVVASPTVTHIRYRVGS